MRIVSTFLLVCLLFPAVSAGTRETPELTDPEGDVVRWPGVPTVDPSSDIIKVWFSEDASNLYLSMEVVQHVDAEPDVPNVHSTADHLIGAFVNGEGERTPCSGWGPFNVRDHDWGASGWKAYLRVYWPMERQGDGCGGDDHDVAVEQEGNVFTMAVPWTLLQGIVAAGDELTVSDARAGSGSTWPATPVDYADEAPGKPYVVRFGPPEIANEDDEVPQSVAPARNETADPAYEASLDAGSAPAEPMRQGRESPAPGVGAFLLALAFVAVAFSRRSAW